MAHPAGLHDRVGAKRVLPPALHAACPRLAHLWADQGYAGVLCDWTKDQTGIEREVVSPWWRNPKRYLPEALDAMGFEQGLQALPHRWVVERTYAWVRRDRRLANDDERLAETTQALIFIFIAMARLMLRRLTSP